MVNEYEGWMLNPPFLLWRAMELFKDVIFLNSLQGDEFGTLKYDPFDIMNQLVLIFRK